ncbi:MAG: hypothetical protein CVU15_11715 [Betaproteobacteria bacterium HGW-Betaproteobacteria-1]|jgi:hypothetical protein|nr:MAG: hypothetical protein CVU15_11715 [Betaproteobacteria bacterium HGW-Betaproteobacteria-1]
MLHRIVLAFALTFLLGFGQQSALLHEVSHLADLDPLSQQQDQTAQHAANCEHCLSISHFSGTIPSSFHFDFDQQSIEEHAISGGRYYIPEFSQTYAARAPPLLI